jgi:hypothetical protein
MNTTTVVPAAGVTFRRTGFPNGVPVAIISARAVIAYPSPIRTTPIRAA